MTRSSVRYPCFDPNTTLRDRAAMNVPSMILFDFLDRYANVSVLAGNAGASRLFYNFGIDAESLTNEYSLWGFEIEFPSKEKKFPPVEEADLVGRNYPVPPWVTQWMSESDFGWSDLDALCGVDYDVGASRFGFNRKNKTGKCRLDPTFGPVLLKHEMTLEDWAAGFDVLSENEYEIFGCNDFEKRLLVRTYSKIFDNAYGIDYAKFVEVTVDKSQLW